jgi:hypothetical protein
MNSRLDVEWFDKVGTAYRHALVHYEMARQDLAVAIAEKNAQAERSARLVFGEWEATRLQLEKVIQGILFAKKGAARCHSLARWFDAQ